MAYNQAGGHFFLYGTDESLAGNLSLATVGVANAAGTKIAMMGSFWTPDYTTKSIRKVGLSFGTGVKSGGSGLTVSLQNVSTTASGPVPDEVQDETVAISNANYPTTAQWLLTDALSSDRSVSPGDTLAVVIEYDGSGWFTPDVFRVSGLQLNSATRRRAYPISSFKSGGSWSVQNILPNVLFECSDGTFGTFMGCPLFSLSPSTLVFKQDSAIDEYAQKITMPFGCKLGGCQIRIAGTSTTSDFDVVLYSSSDSILWSKSVDAAEIVAGANQIVNLAFSSEITVAKNDFVRLAIKPTQTTSNVTIYSASVASASHMVLNPGGTGVCQSHRTNGGAWTDSTEKYLMGFGVMVSAVEEQMSGGGSVLHPLAYT